MFDAHLFTNRLEGNVTILVQARNLTGYALAMTTGGEGQGAITQINQRLQTVIGGLNQIVEEICRAGAGEICRAGAGEICRAGAGEIRRAGGKEICKPEAGEIRKPEGGVDSAMFIKFLTTGERADLKQLNRAHDNMTAVLDTIIMFRERLIDLAKCRCEAGDIRGAGQ